eukprot:CAMPEP_0170997178 /NCGR_PEP_ID=MMETSP0736-20130129/12699_1 /TAXON_ID=186038 /ORGANISM="Fragilariopsis kerguelensis, Strain L26-C5" /LENGTH=367 /DNA_ID=CAMNT_0011423807 /DNA_START=220 /DNA_END=1323 /DNA_ORIENTATION=+
MSYTTSVVAPSSSCTVRRLFFSSSAQEQQQQQSLEQVVPAPVYTTVLKLNMLQDNPGAVKKKRRIGRGIGSSKGKTSGRGHKGQKARAGGSIPNHFEGGQTRFFKLLPKRGFTNKRHKAEMLALNVGTIQDYIDMGRFPSIPKKNTEEYENDNNTDTESEKTPPPITPTVVLTMKDFMEAGLCTASSNKHGMKLLAHGKERVRTPIKIEISRASEAAIAAIEAVGGEVTTVHYNKLALRTLLKPHKYTTPTGTINISNELSCAADEDAAPIGKRRGKRILPLPKNARPNPKWQPYYTNWKNRGYLSVQAQMRKLLFERPDLEHKFTEALAAATTVTTTNENDNEETGKEGEGAIDDETGKEGEGKEK